MALLLMLLLTNNALEARADDGACPSPMGLSAQPSSSTSVVLSWNAVVGAALYELEIEQEPSNSSYEIKVSTADTFYVLGNLNASLQYKFKVRSKCGNDKSDWSAYLYFNTTTGGGGSGSGCTVPLNLAVSDITETTALLQWSAVNGALLYEIEVEIEPSNKGSEFKVSTTSASFALSGLKPGTTYKVKVRAYCNSGKSDWSAYVYFKTSGSGGGYSTCATPTGVAVTIQGNVAVISWDTVAGAAYYHIEIEAKPGGLKWKDSTQTNTYTFSGLNANLQYKFKVRTRCADGTVSAWSKEVYWQTGSPSGGGGFQICMAPTGLQASDITAAGAKLTWQPVAGAIGYQVEIERQPSGVKWEMKVFTSVPEYVLSGLQPNQTYKFKVRTLCASGGKSKWSQRVSFLTPPGLSVPDEGVEYRERPEQAAIGVQPLEVQVLPQPVTTSGRIVLNGLTAGTEVALTLYDLTGRVLWQSHQIAQSPQEEFFLQVQALVPGVYLLRVENNGQMTGRKLIISR